MKRYIVAILTLLLFCCKTDKKQKRVISTKNTFTQGTLQKVNSYQKSGLEGHTFFRVKIENNDTILYQSCIAEIPKYSFSDKQIVHNWGQEIQILEIVDCDVEKNIIHYKTIMEGVDCQDLKIRKIDSRQRLLEIETLYTNGAELEKGNPVLVGVK